MSEPEYITIVEGHTPEFHQTADFSIHSVLEGPNDAINTFTEMRTMNGEAIRERCLRAWSEGRPVRLDYPDEMRLRKELDVVGLRLKEVDEGTVLQLWVRKEIEYDSPEDGDFDQSESDDGSLPF
ncbi:MAG: hypothetical protein AAGD96_02080 [Chloroflexota bacterium]